MTKTRKAQRDAKRLFRLCVVDGVLDDGRALDVVSRVLESRRAGDLAALAHFRRLIRLDLARRTARVESAATLSDVERTMIATGLAQTHGPGLATSFAEDPELIGGVRIRVGGEIYDGSIRGQLAALLERF
jgi:F-type H+-transporting ATPase subunit delta